MLAHILGTFFATLLRNPPGETVCALRCPSFSQVGRLQLSTTRSRYQSLTVFSFPMRTLRRKCDAMQRQPEQWPYQHRVRSNSALGTWLACEPRRVEHIIFDLPTTRLKNALPRVQPRPTTAPKNNQRALRPATRNAHGSGCTLYSSGCRCASIPTVAAQGSPP